MVLLVSETRQVGLRHIYSLDRGGVIRGLARSHPVHGVVDLLLLWQRATLHDHLRRRRHRVLQAARVVVLYAWLDLRNLPSSLHLPLGCRGYILLLVVEGRVSSFVEAVFVLEVRLGRGTVGLALDTFLSLELVLLVLVLVVH